MPSLLHLLLVAGVLNATNATAHEFWIEPDSPSAANIRVGQMLVGETLPYLDHILSSVRHFGPDGEAAVKGRQGDLPALSYDASAQGMHLLTVETEPAYIVFKNMAEFGDYLAYEGLHPVLAAHRKRGLPREEIAEEYFRYARMLVQVGHAASQQTDSPVGLRHELLALSSPFAVQGGEVTVQLLWDGAPNPDVQLAVFHRSSFGAPVTRQLLRSGADGTALVDISSAGLYVINAVQMLPADGPGSVVWQSHWASLSFTLTGKESLE
jgi:uncharacterized GH25 family protein